MYTDKEILELLPPSKFKHLGVSYLQKWLNHELTYTAKENEARLNCYTNIRGALSHHKAAYVFELYSKYKPITKKTKDKLFKYFKIKVDESLCQ